jgi:hypothetical protein
MYYSIMHVFTRAYWEKRSIAARDRQQTLSFWLGPNFLAARVAMRELFQEYQRPKRREAQIGDAGTPMLHKLWFVF